MFSNFCLIFDVATKGKNTLGLQSKGRKYIVGPIVIVKKNPSYNARIFLLILQSSCVQRITCISCT